MWLHSQAQPLLRHHNRLGGGFCKCWYFRQGTSSMKRSTLPILMLTGLDSLQKSHFDLYCVTSASITRTSQHRPAPCGRSKKPPLTRSPSSSRSVRNFGGSMISPGNTPHTCWVRRRRIQLSRMTQSSCEWWFRPPLFCKELI